MCSMKARLRWIYWGGLQACGVQEVSSSNQRTIRDKSHKDLSKEKQKEIRFIRKEKGKWINVNMKAEEER